jgi:hypothetical protein
MLDAWRKSPLYDARERAALASCEAMTAIADGGVRLAGADHGEVADTVAQAFPVVRETLSPVVPHTPPRFKVGSQSDDGEPRGDRAATDLE